MPVSSLSKRRKAWLGAAALSALIAGGALESGVFAATPQTQAQVLSADKTAQVTPTSADVVEDVKADHV